MSEDDVLCGLVGERMRLRREGRSLDSLIVHRSRKPRSFSYVDRNETYLNQAKSRSPIGERLRILRLNGRPVLSGPDDGLTFTPEPDFGKPNPLRLQSLMLPLTTVPMRVWCRGTCHWCPV